MVLPAFIRQVLWNRRHLGTRKTNTGLAIPVASFADWVVYREIFEQQVYDEAIDKALAEHALGSSTVILDLGANVGYFLMRVIERARASKRSEAGLDLVAVEGATETFLTLRNRLQGLRPACRVRLCHGLVGRTNGVAEIGDDKCHFAVRLDRRATDSPAELVTTLVPYVNLEILLPERQITLVKCDIEGSEEAFICEYPSLLSRTKYLCVEFHGEPGMSRCLDMLSQLRFAAVHDVTRQYENNGECVTRFFRNADIT